MNYWADYLAWRERRRELLWEAQERALAREVRKTREAFAPLEKRPAEVKVRWGLSKDEAKVTELLELNGMPRWIAFEERFVVAEKDGELLAAVRYRTEPKRLLLGLLVADPWGGQNALGERHLAVALYAGAWELARDLGVSEIRAKIDRCRADYLYEAGYRRWGCGWRLDPTRPFERREKLPEGGWRRRIALLSAFVAALLLPRKERPKNVPTNSRRKKCDG